MFVKIVIINIIIYLNILLINQALIYKLHYSKIKNKILIIYFMTSSLGKTLDTFKSYL